MDGFANPLLVEALNRTREGLVDVTGNRVAPPSYPAVDSAHLILRWDPWVRMSLLQDELLAGMRFQKPKADAETLELCVGTGRLLALTRPPAQVFADQIDEVLSLASLREDRGPEILSQIDGQWAFWGTILPFRLAQTPKLVELMSVAIQFCVSVELRFKHAFACPRPHELSSAVRPLITTPGHGTYPMGHATQVEAVGVLLKALVKEVLPGPETETADAHQPVSFSSEFDVACETLSFRIAENRIVAGVHYPVDQAGGTYLGCMLGNYLVATLNGQRLLPSKAPAAFVPSSGSETDAYGVQAARTAVSKTPKTKDVSDASAEVPQLLPEVWKAVLREVRIALGLVVTSN